LDDHDPAGLAVVNPTNPQAWNRYAYVENQPCSSIDVLGLSGCNFNIAITNTNNLTDAEAKSAWSEPERLFGLAGLGAVLTNPQSADFTINLAHSQLPFGVQY
jgi:hypothetical protein